jgi:hypothetical protein
MKTPKMVYVLQNTSTDAPSIIGIYRTKEKAMKVFDTFLGMGDRMGYPVSCDLQIPEAKFGPFSLRITSHPLG